MNPKIEEIKTTYILDYFLVLIGNYYLLLIMKPTSKKRKKYIKSNTNLEPKKKYHTVETFIEEVNKDILEMFSDKNKLPIDHFSKRNDFVIT